MKKIVGEVLILAGVFLGCWFFLSQFHFTEYFKVKSLGRSAEEKLGTLVIDYLKKTEKEIDSDSVMTLLNGMKGRICQYNNAKLSLLVLEAYGKQSILGFPAPVEAGSE